MLRSWLWLRRPGKDMRWGPPLGSLRSRGGLAECLPGTGPASRRYRCSSFEAGRRSRGASCLDPRVAEGVTTGVEGNPRMPSGRRPSGDRRRPDRSPPGPPFHVGGGGPRRSSEPEGEAQGAWWSRLSFLSMQDAFSPGGPPLLKESLFHVKQGHFPGAGFRKRCGGAPGVSLI